jgi:hypothetical protein
MSSSMLEHCPHERRPGTTVCLHCRHEEREIARAKRRRFMGRLGIGALGLTVFAVAGVAGAAALQSRQARVVATQPAVEQRVARSESRSEPRQAGTPVSAPTPLSTDATNATSATTPPFVPVIAEGRTDLPDGVYALRAGGNIEVHFDTPEARTRRADKFERLVRTTLPLIYGAIADSMLAKVPQGMVNPKELLTELPARGVQLPIGGGWTLAVHPETRPGQEGPLVVTYRAYTIRN